MAHDGTSKFLKYEFFSRSIIYNNGWIIIIHLHLSLSWLVTVQLFCTHTLYTRIFTALAMSVHNTTCCRGIQAIWQCEEYIQHGTVKIKHVLHTPYIRISLHIRKNCELVWREDVKNLQRRGWAVPPIRSVFRTTVRLRTFLRKLVRIWSVLCEKSPIFVDTTVVAESSCSTSKQIGQ